MLPPLGDTITGVSDRTLAAIPRYLHTLRSYVFMGPRRFFLRSEMASDEFMSPWLFFLTNVSIGAALAAGAVLLIDPSVTWDWDLYKSYFVVSLIQDVILLPCGLVAAWFAVQRVSAETLLTAYAYASAWRLATMPALIYIFAALDRRVSSALLLYIALALLLAYSAYLILGMAAHNFIEGRARRSFGVLTVFLFGLFQVVVILLVAVPSDAWHNLVQATVSHLTGRTDEVVHCDDAIINGDVHARGGDALVWFEWGDSPALGQHTRARRYLDDGPAYEPLVNLRPNTKYYYRIALKGAHAVSYGRTVTLVTPDCDMPIAGSELFE